VLVQQMLALLQRRLPLLQCSFGLVKLLSHSVALAAFSGLLQLATELLDRLLGLANLGCGAAPLLPQCPGGSVNLCA